MTVVPHSYIRMIESRIEPSGYELSEVVKAAFMAIPREYFIEESDKKRAYIDRPLHIPSGQTISAPSMYALMLSTDLGNPKPGQMVLEIGTGSGYGAGLLGYVVGEENVYSIERHKALVDYALENLKKVRMTKINVIHSDGTKNIPDLMFDRIFVTASGSILPKIYIKHLKPRGIIIMPIENEKGEQWVWKIVKDEIGNVSYHRKMQVLFVPLIYDN